MTDNMDDVFKALADPNRRRLLDLLYENNGQTLGALCKHLEMTRQSATQHLGLLEAANLISTVRQGREKFTGAGSLNSNSRAWICCTTSNGNWKEKTMDKAQFVYVTYIRTTPEKVWEALTKPDVTEQYWRYRNVSDWQPGSKWEHQRPGSHEAVITGKVLQSEPPRLLVKSWVFVEDVADESQYSRVTYEITPMDGMVCLTVTHSDLESGSEMLQDITHGWPIVLSNLKTFLETGAPLPERV
jgi:uncharacterized protein YndB with AHSA1/START domain